ncbi:MAG: SufE family protein [Proteobacteria bacterium]|nr:SufE family protein [Pseudomonadota bacterium]
MTVEHISIVEKKLKIVDELSAITDSNYRYKYIINKGRELETISDDTKQDKYLIEGCISRAWLIPELRDGRIYFFADSEAAIVKGIMAILLEVYSGNYPAENLGLSSEFLREVGITEHLSMNRRNGLSSVIKQIMLYSAAYKALAEVK